MTPYDIPPKAGSPAVLYLDFDGVLSNERVRHDPVRGIYLDAPERYSLFQHAPLLNELLQPYPHVRIVLSTSWAQRYTTDYATTRLVPGLRDRVIGATFDLTTPLDGFQYLSRGEQVALDVERRLPSAWLALDDDPIGWPDWARPHLLLTDPYEGISPPRIQTLLRRRLAQLAGMKAPRKPRR